MAREVSMAGARLIGTGQAGARLAVPRCGLCQAGVGRPRHGARARGPPPPGAQAERATIGGANNQTEDQAMTMTQLLQAGALAVLLSGWGIPCRCPGGRGAGDLHGDYRGAIRGHG